LNNGKLAFEQGAISHIKSVSLSIKEPHPQPLPASEEGSRAAGNGGVGFRRIVGNKPDLISLTITNN
jgi:hypothetical protein